MSASFNASSAAQVIGIVGAGTMGAGIAQVAAAVGHPVRLYDVRPNAARVACEQIAKSLAALVDKGRLTEAERAGQLALIIPVAGLAELADATLVVEVIVEDLQAKQNLLRELELHVGSHAILASNTSSISITALANGMQHPERVAGMHFFNPVPLMKLVEVVSGAETSDLVAAQITELARLWGKQPVQAKSTPGFIVNRIARPFYAEALALLQEQAGTPAQLDSAIRSAGFRMGPCELMDLIGHDINYSVTMSLYEASYGDKRYVPSLVQKTLIDGGRLGRKSGRGFYTYPSPASDIAPPDGKADRIEIVGGSEVINNLMYFLKRRSADFDHDVSSKWNGMRIGNVDLHISDGRSAAQLSAELRTDFLGVLDLPLLSEKSTSLCLAYGPEVSAAQREVVARTLAGCSLQAIELRDVPGLMTGRTVSMLINEACDAVYQGVCDEQAADVAMKLGTNYPAGPFEWLALLGAEYTVTMLNNLYAACRSERYRVSPLLQQRYWKLKAKQ